MVLCINGYKPSHISHKTLRSFKSGNFQANVLHHWVTQHAIDCSLVVFGKHSSQWVLQNIQGLHVCNLVGLNGGRVKPL